MHQAQLRNRVIAIGTLVPAAVSLLFILRFAIATPLTDEWQLVYNAMAVERAPTSFAELLGVLGNMHWVSYVHIIIIPNAIYLAVAPLVHYDARFFVFLTLCFNALAVYCGFLRGLRGLALLAASIVVLSPARYMELLWGFQFALGLSVVLGIAGLTLIDSGTGDSAKRSRIFWGLLVIYLGFLSSAPAVFALPSVLLFLLRGKIEPYIPAAALTLVLAMLAVLVLRYGLEHGLHLAVSSLLVTLTAFGALLWSSPVGLLEFGIDVRSITGLLILVADAIVLAAAWRRGTLERQAYGLALVVYGIISVMIISFSRGYLGNWHLPCAVPFILGSFWLLGQATQRYARPVILAIGAVALIGYWNAFTEFGPAYRTYTESVRSYMLGMATNPSAPQPYPNTAGWNATVALVEFLRRGGNPDFTGPP